MLERLSLIFLIAVFIAEFASILCRQSLWRFIVSWAFITGLQFIIGLPLRCFLSASQLFASSLRSLTQSQNMIFWSWVPNVMQLLHL
jgi:hypothetical protein